MKLDWTVWKPRLLYGGFAVAAFVLSLRWTFPGEAVKERLILEAGAAGWQVEIGRVTAGGVIGARAQDVLLEDASGLKVPIESVTASLEVLPLLVGRRVVDFDARLFGGRLSGSAALAGGPLRAKLESLELAQAGPLRTATGLNLVGQASGEVDVVLPATPAEKPTGRITFAVAGAGVNGGKLPIPGMADGLPLQKLSLGAITAAVKLEGGKAVAEKLEAKGGDAELTGDGIAVTLQPKLEYAPLYGRAKVKFQPSFWTKTNMVGMESLLGPKGADGTYGLQVLGFLGHPRVTMGP